MGTIALQDALVAGGYLAAGYNSIHIDDCWMETDPPRNSQGQLQVGPVGDASSRLRMGIVVTMCMESIEWRRLVLGYPQACSCSEVWNHPATCVDDLLCIRVMRPDFRRA